MNFVRELADASFSRYALVALGLKFMRASPVSCRPARTQRTSERATTIRNTAAMRAGELSTKQRKNSRSGKETFG
jgi:hypothetical protein